MARRKVDGTHQGDKSNVPNTCAPRSRRQGDTKAEKRLAARIKDFERNVQRPKTEFHRPGSLKKA